MTQYKQIQKCTLNFLSPDKGAEEAKAADLAISGRPA